MITKCPDCGSKLEATVSVYMTLEIYGGWVPSFEGCWEYSTAKWEIYCSECDFKFTTHSGSRDEAMTDLEEEVKERQEQKRDIFA